MQNNSYDSNENNNIVSITNSEYNNLPQQFENSHLAELENLKKSSKKDLKKIFRNLSVAFIGSLLVIFIFNIATLNETLFVSAVEKPKNFSPDIKNLTADVQFNETSPSFTKGLEISAQKTILISDSFSANSIKLTVDPNKYKTFSGEEFRDFYNIFQYNFTNKIISKPAIRSKPQADSVIQQIAEKRGYQLRSEAVETRLVAVDGQRLQPEAQESWIKLKNGAKAEGINLVLVSGFRSTEDQKGIFNGALGSSFTDDQIAAGIANSAINSVLETISIPGYSRHHTGYTMDIGCDNAATFTKFADTKCYSWISAYNYVNAKRFGFIPSYPIGAGSQGPIPESWEYVWVGEDKLLK